MTIVFGVIAPFFNFFTTSTVGGFFFTIFSGALLAVGLARRLLARGLLASCATFYERSGLKPSAADLKFLSL